MTDTIAVGGLKINQKLYELVKNEIAPGAGLDADDVWAALGQIVADLDPHNRALLQKRDALQQQIDDWYLARQGQVYDVSDATTFLQEIGYLLPEGVGFPGQYRSGRSGDCGSGGATISGPGR